MIRNCFKIAWRSLSKSKLYNLINLGGLSAGITCCILIGIYIANELSFDRFHKNAGRLVRVTTEYTVNGTKNFNGATGSMAGPRLAAAFPKIESFVRIRSIEPYVVQYGEKTFVESRFLFADSEFFKIFSFPLLEGNALTALNEPGRIVITQSMERKYFGMEKALGKVLKVGGTRDYIVSGVAADAPENSQIQFNFIASYVSLPNANTPNWWVHIYSTYFLLHDMRDMPTLEKGIATYMKNQKDLDQAPNDYLIFHLEPITRVHLYSPLSGPEPNGDIKYIFILAAIALMILCIASVNYTNLATAQSANRAAEIGIRKVLGSARWQLFWQFIGESLLLNGAAFIIAFCSAILILPVFNQLVERQLTAGVLLNPIAIIAMLLLYLFVSFVSSVYPAFILSRLNLIKVLKAGFSFTGKAGMLRRSLIVFQFMVSIFLIISTVVIFQQLHYIQHKNLGYDKNQVLVLPVDLLIREHYQSIKEAIQRIPNVVSVSCGAEETTHIQWDDEISATGTFTSQLFIRASPTDIDFVKTMGLHIIAGSDFNLSDWKQMDSTKENPDPHTSFILNETAVKTLGMTPDKAIGKMLYRGSSKGIVKAVVKDFNFAPLHENIAPLVIFLNKGYANIFQAFVKIKGKDVPSTIRAIEETWKVRVPHRPFQYHFLDDNYNLLYHTERQTAKIFSTFSGLAILLSCLGLFALTAYTTVQRAKEIGIRKVLGADLIQILMLISGDFLKLVAIASLIAFPIAWISIHDWLQNFAYRIDIGWWIFLLASLTLGTLTLTTICFQAYRTASANPVESLRSE